MPDNTKRKSVEAVLYARAMRMAIGRCILVRKTCPLLFTFLDHTGAPYIIMDIKTLASWFCILDRYTLGRILPRYHEVLSTLDAIASR